MDAIPGQDFSVDEKHLKLISAFKWKKDQRKNLVYFYTNLGGRKIYLHRFLMGLFAKIDVDHKDRNTANNVLSNLRFSSRSQNIANAVKHRDVSPYRGIFKKKNRWVAEICVDDKVHRRYGFFTAEDAAKAYDKLSYEFHGDFGIRNFELTK